MDNCKKSLLKNAVTGRDFRIFRTAYCKLPTNFLFLFQFILTLKGLLLFFYKAKIRERREFRACIIMRKSQFFLEFLLHIGYNNTRKISLESGFPTAAKCGKENTNLYE